MTIELNNIGMIKEAIVKIDGLTVIAGENDTGKSSLSKVLYTLIQSIRWASNIHPTDDKNYVSQFNNYKNKLFENQISMNGDIKFYYDNNITFKYKIGHDTCTKFTKSSEFQNELSKLYSPLFIETPFVWNLSRTLTTINSNHNLFSDIDFKIPFMMENLFSALNTETKSKVELNLNIQNIINGKFNKREFGDFYFERDDKEYKLTNVAMGIKYFGLFQVLEKNGHFYDGQILILDEPEVHLHPKWQLKMAEIIVELVKSGVKVLVNSHSPYMIEALKRYSEVEEIENKTNFYLAEEGYITEQESLENIFEKLALPMRELKKLKMDRYLND
ncbi:MAG: AAA family ATPase [Sulfurimonas sp.]|jgi:predicted ATPase